MNEPNPQSGEIRATCLCGKPVSQELQKKIDDEFREYTDRVDQMTKNECEGDTETPSPTVTEKVPLDRRKTLKEELKRHDRRLFYQADDHTYWDTERLRVVLRFRDKIHQKHREELEREKRALVKLLERCLGDLSYDLYVEAKWLLQKHQIRDNFQNR